MPHRPIENKAMLITYADSLGKDLKDLEQVLDGPLAGAFGGVHILPFFPSSGDRGFSPITYREVDPVFGTWDDIDRIGSRYYLMYDYMINHISVRSPEYRDFLEKKDESRYRDFFIRFKDFWENGEPTEEEDKAIYRRRIGKGTYIMANFADGTSEKGMVHLLGRAGGHQLPAVGGSQTFPARNAGIPGGARVLPDPAGRVCLRDQKSRHQLLLCGA